MQLDGLVEGSWKTAEWHITVPPHGTWSPIFMSSTNQTAQSYRAQYLCDEDCDYENPAVYLPCMGMEGVHSKEPTSMSIIAHHTRIASTSQGFQYGAKYKLACNTDLDCREKDCER